MQVPRRKQITKAKMKCKCFLGNGISQVLQGIEKGISLFSPVHHSDVHESCTNSGSDPVSRYTPP